MPTMRLKIKVIAAAIPDRPYAILRYARFQIQTILPPQFLARRFQIAKGGSGERDDDMLIRIGILILAFAAITVPAWAQELDPRAYQPAPVGLNVFSVGYTHSFGDVVFDPSFPAKDVEASLHIGGAGYYRSLDFFGRFANITVGVPYAAGHMNGTVNDEAREIYRSGLGDIRGKLAVNIKGTPAMTLGEFMKHKQVANLAVSLVVSAPTGQYDSSKVINIGQNRWAFKPEVALTKAFGNEKWQADIYGGIWLFAANHDLLGKTQTQAPLYSFQFHLTRNFGKGYWLGLNSNFYTGARTTVNGVRSATEQRNSRLGGTLAVPIGRGQSVKFAVSRGAFVARGGNFTSFGASYNYAWGLKR